jgi:hypothetical protein
MVVVIDPGPEPEISGWFHCHFPLSFYTVPMRRRTYFLVFGIILLAIVGGVVFFHSSEPSYDGRTLSRWMADYWECVRSPPASPSMFSMGMYIGYERDSPRLRAATNAIRRLAPEAIPFMLEWMDYGQPGWSERFCSYVNELKGTWRIERRIERYIVERLERPSVRSRNSAVAFRAVGSSAKAAIPRLKELLKSPKPGVADNAILALVYLGPNGLPPLMEALADKSRTNRDHLAEGIARMGTNGRPAIPVLVHCLKEPNNPDLYRFAFFLRQLQPDPSLVIPELIAIVADPKLRKPLHIDYLGSFGRAASNAVPALIEALKDPDPQIRMYASNTLQRIEPR